MLEIDVHRVDCVRELLRHIAEFAAVVAAERHVRVRTERSGPSTLQRHLAELADRTIRHVVFAAEDVALDQPFTAATWPVDANADLSAPPPILRGDAAVEDLRIPSRELAVNAIRCARRRAAVAKIRERRILIPAAEREQRALAVARVARDDIDDTVDGVRAPEGRARPADHLDPLDVLERVIEHVPEGAAEQRAVLDATVDHDEQLVRGGCVEAARRHGPGSIVEARDLDAVGERERVRNRGDAGAADVVVGDDGNGGRGTPYWLGLPRRQRDVDLHELLDRHRLEVLRIGLNAAIGCQSRPMQAHRDGDDHGRTE